jgi:GT2 family glycosyltransferase
MGEEILISIIIPTYKDWDRLDNCLAAVLNQTIDQDLYDVIVVNNDTGDVPGSLIQTYPGVNFLQETRPGSYAARNHGLAHAVGDLIAFTDSDCIPKKDWLENALTLFQEGGTERVAGNVELVTEGTFSSGQYWDRIFGFPQEDYVQRGFAVTANLICKAELFDRVGLFNSELLSGGDYDWNMRASKEGVSLVYAENVTVCHPARDLQELITKARRVSGKYFHVHGDRPFWRKALTGFYIFLTPPINEIKSIFSESSLGLSVIQKFQVGFVALLRRYVEGIEHFRLLLGFRQERR